MPTGPTEPRARNGPRRRRLDSPERDVGSPTTAASRVGPDPEHLVPPHQPKQPPSSVTWPPASRSPVGIGQDRPLTGKRTGSRVLDALEELALQELPRWQLGQVAGDAHGALGQLEELDLLLVLVGA
jgi:hypothetical protein